MLKKILINGLRGFGECKKIEFALPNSKPGSGLNMIVGPNNSGKTTIVEAIKCYNCEAKCISFSEGKRNLKNNNKIDIIYVDENDNNLELHSAENNGSQVIINGEINKNKIPYVLPSRRYVEYNMNNNSDYLSDRNNYSSNLIQYSKNRTSTLTQFDQRIFKWQKHKEKFDQYLKQIIVEPFDWIIEQNDNGSYYIKIIFSNNSIYHTREGIGDGYWSIFTIIDALYDSKENDIIVIDEPELSLHPAFQKRLIDLLEFFSKDRQIVITTHSPYLVSLNAIINGGNLIRTHKDENGNIVIGMIDNDDRAFINSIVNDLNNPHILGIEAKELFFIEDNVIITEGQEDVVIYSKICKKLNIDLKASLFGWGAGGADNICKILHLLQNLGYKKVTAIYDGDKEKQYKNSFDNYSNYNILLLFKDDIRDKKEIFKKGKEGVTDKNGNIKNDNIDNFIAFINSINSYHSD